MAAAFAIIAKNNQEFVIIVAIDIYKMGINNLDVKLIIQQNIFMYFDLIIQCIGQVSKKKA